MGCLFELVLNILGLFFDAFLVTNFPVFCV